MSGRGLTTAHCFILQLKGSQLEITLVRGSPDASKGPACKFVNVYLTSNRLLVGECAFLSVEQAPYRCGFDSTIDQVFVLKKLCNRSSRAQKYLTINKYCHIDYIWPCFQKRKW